METSLVLGWIFFVLVAALFIGLILLPCLRVLLTPEITGIGTVDEGKHIELKNLVKEARRDLILVMKAEVKHIVASAQ